MYMLHNTGLVVTHLNAPYGLVVTEEDLARSLRTGKIVADNAAARAVIAQVFIETEPRLLVQCAREIGVPIAKVNALYRDTLANGAPANPAWEKAMELLL